MDHGSADNINIDSLRNSLFCSDERVRAPNIAHETLTVCQHTCFNLLHILVTYIAIYIAKYALKDIVSTSCTKVRVCGLPCMRRRSLVNEIICSGPDINEFANALLVFIVRIRINL